MAATPQPDITNLEEVLDRLAILIQDIEVVRQKEADRYLRAALGSQIAALAKWWRKIDAGRMQRAAESLSDDIKELDTVTGYVKEQKSTLSNVAKVIEGAAKAIAIAERVWKLIP